MPNWLDALTNPIIPRRALAGLQNALAPGSGDAEQMGGLSDIPGALSDLAGTVGEHPGAALGGFASGALEGLRGLTSPINLAAVLPWGRLGKPLLGAAGGAIRETTTPGMKAVAEWGDDALKFGGQVPDIPVPQSMPKMPEVDSLLGGMRSNLDQIPKRDFTGPGIPEFVPPGMEAAFNASRTPKMSYSTPGSQVMEALNRWKGEMGEEGLRELNKTARGMRFDRSPR